MNELYFSVARFFGEIFEKYVIATMKQEQVGSSLMQLMVSLAINQ